MGWYVVHLTLGQHLLIYDAMCSILRSPYSRTEQHELDFGFRCVYIRDGPFALNVVRVFSCDYVCKNDEFEHAEHDILVVSVARPHWGIHSSIWVRRC